MAKKATRSARGGGTIRQRSDGRWEARYTIGFDPATGKRLLHSWVVQIVKTIMLTCGMYDGSGKFAVEVGVPSKSGVGGGILSVVDKRMGIGIFGPSLDEKGNSIAGQHVLRELSAKMKLHMFADNVPEF